MSAKYTPIAGYPDGVYNFGPRYDDTSTRASSRSLDAPAPDSASQFAQRRTHSSGGYRARRRENPRARPARRARCDPINPRTRPEPLANPLAPTAGRDATSRGSGPSSR